MAYVYSWQFGARDQLFDFSPCTARGGGRIWQRSDSPAILAGEPIDVYNHGDMRRDFTYIDDIVKGVVTVLDRASGRTPTACRIGLQHRQSSVGTASTIHRSTVRRAGKEADAAIADADGRRQGNVCGHR